MLLKMNTKKGKISLKSLRALKGRLPEPADFLECLSQMLFCNFPYDEFLFVINELFSKYGGEIFMQCCSLSVSVNTFSILGCNGPYHNTFFFPLCRGTVISLTPEAEPVKLEADKSAIRESYPPVVM